MAAETIADPANKSAVYFLLLETAKRVGFNPARHEVVRLRQVNFSVLQVVSRRPMIPTIKQVLLVSIAQDSLKQGKSTEGREGLAALPRLPVELWRMILERLDGQPASLPEEVASLGWSLPIPNDSLEGANRVPSLFKVVSFRAADATVSNSGAAAGGAPGSASLP